MRIMHVHKLISVVCWKEFFHSVAQYTLKKEKIAIALSLAKIPIHIQDILTIFLTPMCFPPLLGNIYVGCRRTDVFC